MDEDITTDGRLTIGLDLGDTYSEAVVLDRDGEELERFRVRTTQLGLSRRFAGFEAARVVLEVGTHSPGVSRLLAAQGHEVIVANPRRVRLIAESDTQRRSVGARRPRSEPWSAWRGDSRCCFTGSG